MKIYLNSKKHYFEGVKYTLKIIEDFSEQKFQIIDEVNDADIIIDNLNEKSIPFNDAIYKEQIATDHLQVFRDQPLIRSKSGFPDYLSSIYYLINCIQEYKKNSNNQDEYGRFKFEVSLQKRFNIIEENLVLDYIFKFLSDYNISRKQDFCSKIFTSHDIDTINGSLLQDGFWAIKNKRIDVLASIIFREILNRGEWKNIDKIADLHTEYGIKTTFFWLVNKGIGEKGIKNSDYKINNQLKFFRHVQNRGGFNGLHKSSSIESLSEELKKLPINSNLNRHHFLKYSLPELWNELENSGIKFDSSLGFAERYGFRNSFAYPFRPFNHKTQQSHNFIEMPLMVMDGSFQKYLKIPVGETSKYAIDFFEKHKSNSYLSLLWHNTHFTNFKYKGYKEEYIKIIKYLKDMNFEFTNPEEIIQKFENND
jgi:peptidoglycan/xylan/chitin deacetylase (PgdA/CDA1 family)